MLVCALVATSVIAAAETVQFELLNDPVSGTWANYSLSKNGKAMAANYGGDVYHWTAASGFTFLGTTDFLSSSIGISADGSTIVASRAGNDGNVNPAMWTKAAGWVDLGHPSNGCEVDGSWGSGYDVNSNGTIVVGLAWYCPARAEGFKWTHTDGMISLGHPSGASSRASAISANGTTIVGFAENPQTGERRPVLWPTVGRNFLPAPALLARPPRSLRTESQSLVRPTMERASLTLSSTRRRVAWSRWERSPAIPSTRASPTECPTKEP